MPRAATVPAAMPPAPCAARFMPAVCMRCISRDLEWKEASGRGTVYSYTVTHLPPEGFEGREPYVLVSVDLPEGARVLGTLVGVAAEDVRIGMPVHATYERLTDDITLVQFAAER